MKRLIACVGAALLAGGAWTASAGADDERGRGYGDPYRGRGAAYGSSVVCNSNSYEYRFCPAYERVRSAQLVRRRSDAPCRYGSSWGYNARGVWVTDGCRGEFAINAGRGRPGRGGGRGYDDDSRPLAQTAAELCEREGERRVRRNGGYHFHFGRRADIDGARGRGWRVSGPARVRTWRGEERVYVDCIVERFEVVSFDMRR